MCVNHSLNLVVVDCAKSSTEALLFFGVLAQLHTVFSSSTSRRTIMIMSDVLDALEELQSYCIQKQDGKTANDVRSLINVISSWKFILAIVAWHDNLFQVYKTSKFMQTCGISSDVIKSEIHTTQYFL